MTHQPNTPSRFSLRRFRRGEEGVAAVEFALLLPVMLTLYMGSIELTQALTADRRIVLLARTLGDLTTQSSTLTAADMTGIVAAASSVMAPMSTSPAKIRITSVAISSSGSADPKVPNKASVCWSYQNNWTAYTRGTVLDTSQLPEGLRTDTGTSVVIAEVQYPYKPVIGYVFTGSFNLSERLYMRPRLSTYVARSDLANSGIPNPTTGPCT
ncbi:TadE/TadG family type IV pilus assembly protein [uncultured Alsobacter sp.]|uniref:TadE/TadG family type IV pilus assembly protein n=1 Tax=uncultured Alsobacter sp. TaxID=1748258 RepID=UPI0025E046EA|nr:TadE/TadG family type IV pilus assembly protein [uncultured Alsobacter sp.]